MANQIAYGFIGLEHLFLERLENVNVQTVTTAIQESVAEHNRQAQALMAELAQGPIRHHTRSQERGRYTLQPVGEDRRPRPTRPGWRRYWRARACGG